MVNYPHKIGKKITRTSSNISQHIDFANRGMSFESAINVSNAYYLAHGLAVIHKKPTPVQIVKVAIRNEAELKLLKLISVKHPRQIILVFLRDTI